MGGLLTILTYTIVLAYTYIKANQMIVRDNPNVTSTTEFTNYETDDELYNLEQNETEAVIRFEMMQENGETWSWDKLDDRFGRVIAYQVAEKWPLREELGGGAGRRMRGKRRYLEEVSTVASFYTDTSEDTAAMTPDIPAERMLEIRECDQHHLWNLQQSVREATLAKKNRKCVNMTKG